MESELTIDLYTNKKAIKVVSSVPIVDDESSASFVRQWAGDIFDRGIAAFVLKTGTRIHSFALFSQLDFDPLKEFTHPYSLMFIYTCPESQRKGYAARLVNYIKDVRKVEFIASCMNEKSRSLFRKCNCRDMGDYCHTRMFRSSPRTGVSPAQSID